MARVLLIDDDADGLAAQLVILGRGAYKIIYRSHPAKDLLDCVGEEFGMILQFAPLIWMLAEGMHGASNRVASGLVASLDQKLAIADQLFMGQGHTVDRALHQEADQVLSGITPPVFDHLGEVLVHVDLGSPSGLFRSLAR